MFRTRRGLAAGLPIDRASANFATNPDASPVTPDANPTVIHRAPLACSRIACIEAKFLGRTRCKATRDERKQRGNRPCSPKGSQPAGPIA
jgi:hypothetical protein